MKMRISRFFFARLKGSGARVKLRAEAMQLGTGHDYSLSFAVRQATAACSNDPYPYQWVIQAPNSRIRDWPSTEGRRDALWLTPTRDIRTAQLPLLEVADVRYPCGAIKPQISHAQTSPPAVGRALSP
jgi:hypothetical protein